ncbi:T-cell immunoglobulin and mucin domain-containing protein 4 [Carlito syrichta]|uniref:T-cell immunoglobulin and mucin domain-containing protein 4 n=1 Tax=Carlito syrichta TaxID=1868482 RepID=UPI000B53530A|nr:T-cell immunoglobulin and mucin domain-containing protein 4 [Carlito syrichta]
MSKGPLILWLVIELGQLYLTSAASEIVVMAFVGQQVTLPCVYASWSQGSNSMCWGRGQCPNSKCSQELVHTDGAKVTWRKSAKYQLWGDIQQGNVSLTMLNPREDDGGVYCCRIEVPGWFNDVKKNIHLQLRKAPTTTRRTTTTTVATHRTTAVRPATSPRVLTTTAMLPTSTVTTPVLTTRTPLPTSTTAALTTAVSTCPPAALSSPPGATTGLVTPGPSTEGSLLTAESETILSSSDSWRSTESTYADTTQLTSKGMNMKLQMMVIPLSLGFVLLALLVFFLRGKVMGSNCLQKHTRLDDSGDSKNVLSDMQHEREDENGLFTL